MKMLIQFALIVVLIFVLFQAVVGGSATASDRAGLGTASNISFLAHTTSEDFQMAACLVGIKGVVCIKPNVGWNS